MVGFTISLRQKKKHFRGQRRKKIGRKFIYFLPVIFIMIFSLTLSFFIPNNTDKTQISEKNAVEIFKETNNYSIYFLPVVINEVFSFKEGESLPSETLVSIGVWSIIGTEEMKKHEAFDGEIIISKKEIENRIHTIFSEKTVFENQSVIRENFEIIFDEENEVYIIPTLGFSPTYTAILQSVVSKSDETVLHVGCLQSEHYKQDSSGKTVLPEAEKILEITLKKENGRFYIHSISEEKT